MITAQRLREVANYDENTGIFTWAVARKGCSAGKVRGKSVYLGVFESARAAHEAYMTAKRSMHEGNTI